MLVLLSPTRLPTLAFSASKPLLRLKPSPPRFIRSSSSSSSSTLPRPSLTAAMSSQTIEHVVLFKVRDGTDSSKIASMATGLNGLASLDHVLFLSAGAIHRNRSSSFDFTHILHSRYKTKDDLSAYSLHPDHLAVVRGSVLPICDDIMAVDWVADGFDGSAPPPPGSAMRLTLLKVKEGLGEAEKGQILGVIRGMKEVSGSIDQMSVGENFSPARAKGFSVASIATFPTLAALEAMDSKEEIVKLQKEKVRDLLESVIVVDYVIPPAQSASL